MLTQKQKDLSRLLDILSNHIFTDRMDAIDDQWLKNLSIVGQLLRAIDWKETDESCIRNKHGLRNRHMNKGNKLNTTGAKLDFETLSHLDTLAADKSMRAIVLQHRESIEQDLRNLKTKIDYIIAAEDSFLSQEQRMEVPFSDKKSLDSEESEVGFLRKIAAYHHDQACLNQLILQLDAFDTMIDADLNDAVHRYKLGYIFCQLGENAKELSCFVKPEKYKQADDNLTRFMFGKLGHYRQVIKQHPYIIRKNNTRELRQMRLLIKEASPKLKRLLTALQIRLKSFEIGDYHTCNLPDHTKKSAFENEWINDFNSLTHQLTLGITFFDDLILKGERYSDDIKKLSAQQHLLDQSTQQLTQASVVNLSKGVASIQAILNKEELSSHLDRTVGEMMNPSTTGTNLMYTLSKALKNKNNTNHIATLCGLEHGISTLSLGQLKNQLGHIATQQNSDINPSHSSLAQQADSLTKRIAQREAEHTQIKQDIEFLQKSLYLQRKAKASRSAPMFTSGTYFSYIFDEIILIENFYLLGETSSSEAVKMALGWIGHYAKEIRKKSDIDKKIKQYTHALVESCFKKAEFVRSKMIMHDMTHTNVSTIEQVWHESILPTKDDIRALSIILDESNQSEGLLARAFMRLGEHDHALATLEIYLAKLKAGHIPVKTLNNDPAVYKENVKPLLEMRQIIRRIGIDTIGEEKVSEYENFVNTHAEISTMLMLMAKCYQNKESETDLKKGFTLIEEALKAITFQLSILRQNTLIAKLGHLTVARDSKLDEWFFCQSIKNYFMIKMNKAEEAASCMIDIEKMFDAIPGTKSKFSSRIIQTLTDLASLTEDSELQKSYIEKAQKYLAGSDRKAFSGYLIQLRSYEQAYDCFSKEQNPVNYRVFCEKAGGFVAFFNKYKSHLQQENGRKIFEYEMTVLLADLTFKLTNTELYAADIPEVFKQLDAIEKHVTYGQSKSHYFSLKIIYLAKTGKPDLFRECVEYFIDIGEKNDAIDYRDELIKMLNSLLFLNLKPFILIALDVIELRFESLTEDEVMTKMLAQDRTHTSIPHTHFIVQNGFKDIVKQLTRITSEQWGYTNNAAILVSSTAPLDEITIYLESVDIGKVTRNKGPQQSISVSNFKGKNLSNIEPMMRTSQGMNVSKSTVSSGI
ncbi:MAG: hypothetical protein CK424_00360 [Legionella sp.]|nr:MAG: hypothetical protein CK424_00360 [Legionella sp.]